MRIAQLLMIVMTAAAFAVSLVGCERDSGSGSDSNPPPVVTATTAPTSRRALPTTDEVFGRLSSATGPSTTQSSFTGPASAGSASDDPLATPDSAVTHLFDLMQKQDVTGVRSIMADPSLPLNQLSKEVSGVAERLRGGAKWDIVQSRTEGVAAVVIFRTRFPDGRQEISPLVLVNRYDRWKVLLGPLNLKKYTPGEKESMNKVLVWAGKRLEELRGPSTAPATGATTKPAIN
jgi:hypothetical protein